MSAASRTTTTAVPQSTSPTTGPHAAARLAIPLTAVNPAPAKNASAAQTLATNITGAQGTTAAPNQNSLAPSAQPAPLLPPVNSATPTPSAPCPSAPNTKAKSKKLSHLSHISAATWISVGLALGALVVAVYYGAPMWRLARWTALNDFRASCISDHDRGIRESARCKSLLADPAKPPPVVRRAVDQAPVNIWTTASRWALAVAVTVATLIAYLVGFKGYAEEKHRLQDSMAKSDFSKIHKCGAETERMKTITPPWASDTTQEQGGRECAEDNDYSVDDGGQTGAYTNDTASEFEWDDGQIPIPVTDLYQNQGEVGSNVALSSKEASIYSKVLSTRSVQESHNSLSSNYSADYFATNSIKINGDIPKIWSVDVEQDPIMFDGPISAFKPRDSIGVMDLRVTKKSNRHLRAIKVPMERGISICKLMLSCMLTGGERYQVDDMNDRLVWEGNVDARLRILSRLSPRSRRHIYLILDRDFVRNVCAETIGRKIALSASTEDKVSNRKVSVNSSDLRRRLTRT